MPRRVRAVKNESQHCRSNFRSFEDVRVPGAFIPGVFDSALCANGDRHLVDQWHIKHRARRIGSGRSVTPSAMTPCKTSLHQSYAGISRGGIARAGFTSCDAFSCRVMRWTRSAARSFGRKLGIHVRKVGGVLRNGRSDHDENASGEDHLVESSGVVLLLSPKLFGK